MADVKKIKLPDNTIVNIKDYRIPGVDTVPTSGSGNVITSGGIYAANYAGSDSNGGPALKTYGIPYGAVDSTSTATVITATVDNFPTELRDGVCAYIRNDIISSADGWTLNVNGTGAKPVYTTTADATRVTTQFSAATTYLFIYNSTRVSGGCWDLYYGYDSNSDINAYQIRTNAVTAPTKNAFYRYRLLFTSSDGQYIIPANTSTSTNATASRNVTQEKIDPFGPIWYYNTTAVVNANASVSASYLWMQYSGIPLGYSFNRTGAALTLTAKDPVYIKCAPQTDGSAIIDANTPFVQSLPSTEDGKIYIFLGYAESATAVTLYYWHPVYYYKDSAIRLWTNAADTKITVDTELDLESENPISNGAVTQVIFDNEKVTASSLNNLNDRMLEAEDTLSEMDQYISDLGEVTSAALNDLNDRMFGLYVKPANGIPVSDLANDVIPDISGKQDVLVSGVNIKTINQNSILGSGDITIPKGEKGDTGDTPTFSIGTVSTGAAGSQASASISGTVAAPILNLTIPQGIQGIQGNTGSSVDYPYELINNLTTDNATKGLSAAQGKILGDKTNILEAKIDGGSITNATTWTTGSTLNEYGNIYSNGNSAFCRTNPTFYCNTGDIIKFGTDESGYRIGFAQSETAVKFSIVANVSSVENAPKIIEFTVETPGYYMVGAKTVGFNYQEPQYSKIVEGLIPRVEDIEQTLEQIDLLKLDTDVTGSNNTYYPEIITGQYISSYGDLITGQTTAYARTVPYYVEAGYRLRMYTTQTAWCNIGFSTTENVNKWTVIRTGGEPGYKEWIVDKNGFIIFSSLTSDFDTFAPRIYDHIAVTLDDVREVVNATYKRVFVEQLPIEQRCLGNVHIKLTSSTKILLYGDSIFSSDNGGSGGLLATKLADITGAEVVARGFPGCSTAQLTDEQRLSRIWDGNPDVIILQYGGNETGSAGTIGTFDGSIPGEPICNPVNIDVAYNGTYMIQALDYIVRRINKQYYNLRQRVGAELGVAYTTEQAEQVAALKKPLLICTTCLPQRRNGESSQYSLKENHIRKRNAMVEVCNRHGILLCDTYNLWGVDIEQEPIYMGVDLNFINKGNYTCDGVHPNTYGYDRLAGILAGTIM